MLSAKLFSFLGLFMGCHLWVADSWTIDQNRRQAIAAGVSTATSGAASILIAATANPLSARADGSSKLSDLSTFQPGPRGLQYKILKEGEGEPPVRAQQVKTKYTLWTGGFGKDGGKQVESNNGLLGQPLKVAVGVGRVIKGWDLTLLDMKVGEVRRIVVPSDLGYGDRGAGGSIPPKATLYFEMELTEMDPMIEMNDQQRQWLQDNPL